MSKRLPPVSRETLYEEIWAEPVLSVAPRYGLSDVGLLKVCKRLRIPVPGRGYWAKFKAGQSVSRKPLPTLPPGTHVPAGPAPLSEAQLTARRRRANALRELQKAGEAITVPDTLENPLPLILEARTRLERREEWSHPAGIRSAPKEVLDIQVSDDHLDRALRIMDTVLKSLGDLGFTTHVNPESGTTVLTGGGTTQTLALVEQVSREKHTPTRSESQAIAGYRNAAERGRYIPYPKIPEYDYIATGRLTLHLGPYPKRRQWNDTDHSKLEARLTRIIAEMMDRTEAQRLREAEEAHRERAYQAAREKYNAYVDATNREWDQLKSMLRDARRHQRAQSLREYLTALQSHAEKTGSMTPAQAQRIQWGFDKADWLDPVINRIDPILDAPEPERPHYWSY